MTLTSSKANFSYAIKIGHKLVHLIYAYLHDIELAHEYHKLVVTRMDMNFLGINTLEEVDL